MLGIKYELVQKLSIIFVGSLVAAAVAGLSLLKFYEEFRRGVEQKSRLRIWTAFFGLSFVILFFVFSMRII